jgi:predicted ArsR family transcriptional regulator
MIHDNSLMAYVSIAPELSKRQREVLAVFKDGKQYTDKEIADILGLEINQVTGRIKELILRCEIAEVGKIKVAGRPRRLCQVVKNTLF